MIKTTAILSARNIHIAIRDFFITLIVLIALLFFWLFHGINIDKLDIGKYRIEKLYIKLNKKLTLKIAEISFPKKKSTLLLDNADKTFDRIKNLLTFFDTVALEKVHFKNNSLALFYADNILYITSNDYEIVSNISREKKELVADISLLYLKKDHVTISGKLRYDLKKNKLKVEGVFDAYGIKGKFRAIQQDKEIVYALNTDEFDTLSPLIKRFKMDPAIESWVIDKVQAKHYKIEYLKGKISIDKGTIKFNPVGLNGKVLFNDVSIRYHDALSPAYAKNLRLTYRKGNLYFDLEDPMYQGRDLNGTTVVIKHIVGSQSPSLTLDLHIVSPMDNKVEEILRAYSLKIPVQHTGEKNQIIVNLKIPLGRSSATKKIKAIVDVNIDKGLLKITDLPLYVEGGKAHYESGMLLFEEIGINETWCKGKIGGKVNIDKQYADLSLKVDDFILGEEKNPFIEIKEKKLPLHLSYNKTLYVNLPTLKTEIQKSENTLHISLSDIGLLVPFLQQNILGLNGGKLQIISKDFKQYEFNGTIQDKICLFYDSSNTCYTHIPVNGIFNTKTEQMTFDALNQYFYTNATKTWVQLKDINIDLKLFLAEHKKFQKRNKKEPLSHKKFIIIGKNSQLRYGSYSLVTDTYDIEILPNGDIEATGSIDGDVVRFTKEKEHFTINAFRVKDRMLHPLINFTGLKNGRYSLKKEGNPDTKMKGRIIIEGGVLSDFKVYNNILALINTLPALTMFNNPGFSVKGFKIEEGVVEYTMTPKKIILDSIYLKGSSAVVLGKGEIDTVTKKINVKLAILTIRDFGKIVSTVPLLGYILMGDNDSMTVGMTISGTLDHPKVSTSVAKDILTLPVEILKRMMMTPVKLRNQKQNLYKILKIK
ncbi:MAG: AsmA-like C-terminal domain-containing protein [Sulfurovum sp.]|nr:AsmA-like C-terminal domain-containing protein [Sulfurovum sp.]